MAFKFDRGIWVRDRITGFTGCIISRMDSITGCNQYAVQPELDKEGKHVNALWLDEHSLEIYGSKQQIKLHREPEQPPG